MKYALTIAVISYLGITATNFAQPYSIEGRTYILYVSFNDVLNTVVQWKPGEGEPPLLPNAALVKAQGALKSLSATPLQWFLERIEIPCMRTKPGVKYNYYRFTFSRNTAFDEHHHPISFEECAVAVLMDGRVILPKLAHP